ncbi:addiction module protein [Candidatus Thiosymbion oneisti]|uniref:addiction module protein n=1 Tax=Candidatus Thiosymbion oneisti TaxID=589554 RepID=UPI00105F57DF|nr:addiction module protein [Candidatus Thiosymbion oneisti]
MTIGTGTVEELALDLDPERRARLAGLLIESLDDAESVDEVEIERLWLREAEHRCRQIDAGEVELIPAQDVLDGLRNHSR